MDEILKQIYEMSNAQMQACADHVMLGGGTRGGPVLAGGKGRLGWDTDVTEYTD